MLGIIEGCDLTGKTTLVEKLGVLMGGPKVRHATRPMQHPLKEYELSLEKYRPHNEGNDLLLDRWHLGERVWPGIFQRETRYDVLMHRHVELFLQSRGALMILAESRESSIISRLKTRKEDITAEQVPEVLARFKTAFKSSTVMRVAYDFERDDLPKFMADAVGTMLRDDLRVKPLLDVTPNWIGDPFPQVLYVGEQAGDGEVSHLPFVPFENTSGWYLMDALPAGKLAIVNARTPNDDVEHVDEVWRLMVRPKVVALGNVAHGVLEAFGIPHGVAPHPQFVRRFHHDALAAGVYRHALLQAVLGVDTRTMFR